MATTTAPSSRSRPTSAPTGGAAVERARRLNVLTIAWNGTEGVIAVVAGLAAGSVSLVGFGFDSAIEVSAALILAWRLHQERSTGCTQESDRARHPRDRRRASRRSPSTWGSRPPATCSTAPVPRSSAVGIVLASLSLSLMPVLARAKRRLAPALGSAAVIADAKQTNLCALMSARRARRPRRQRGARLVVGRSRWPASASPPSPAPRPSAPGAPRPWPTPAAA